VDGSPARPCGLLAASAMVESRVAKGATSIVGSRLGTTTERVPVLQFYPLRLYLSTKVSDRASSALIAGESVSGRHSLETRASGGHVLTT
jgi:hypothetical protein